MLRSGAARLRRHSHICLLLHDMPDNEILIRVGAFLLCLLLLLGWEHVAPRRPVLSQHWLRRINNLALILVSIIIIQLLPLLALAGVASLAAEHSWGLFNRIETPFWLAVILSMIFLDLAIYWQHRLFHRYEWLWRLHRVHHCDREFDVTTGIRFHPLELIISVLVKSLIIVLIGAPAVAVVLFELILNILPMFNHSNVRIPRAIDNILRKIIVTPDMHRVHHSVIRDETDSNFCFSVPWWDHLFHSYRDQPREGHDDMHIGLEEFRGSDTILLHKLLLQPFRRTRS